MNRLRVCLDKMTVALGTDGELSACVVAAALSVNERESRKWIEWLGNPTTDPVAATLLAFQAGLNGDTIMKTCSRDLGYDENPDDAGLAHSMILLTLRALLAFPHIDHGMSGMSGTIH